MPYIVIIKMADWERAWYKNHFCCSPRRRP